MKKCQIFISSTFEDLQSQRKKIIENILDMNHIPAAMEHFSSSNREAFEYIQNIIDLSDYIVLVIGDCYGSINDKTKLSFTEMEYNYAKQNSIPILVFIKESSKNITKKTKDAQNLKNFVNKAKENRIVKFWSNDEELITSIINSINEEERQHPRPGWTRNEKDINQKSTPTMTDFIVSNYKNNNFWYEKYKSGKIRQGSIINAKPNKKRQITLLCSYVNSSYHVQFQNLDDNNCNFKITKLTNSTIELIIEKKDNNSQEILFSYIAEGY